MVKKVILYSFLAICFIGTIALGIIQTNQLTHIQATLTTTQNELAVTQTDLSDIQASLATTKTNLSQTQADLSTTQNNLSNTQNELQATSKKLENTTLKLNQTKEEYNKTYNELVEEKELYGTTQISFDNLQANYNALTTGYGYVLRDPTYQEVKAFIATDTTDLNTYVAGSYVCEDFSFDVKNRAIQQKIHCAFIYVVLLGNAHAIVAFNTIDKGIVYIEPQTDEEVNLQIGKHYWSQCVIPSPGHYYSNPTDYDDTVKNFYVIW